MTPGFNSFPLKGLVVAICADRIDDRIHGMNDYARPLKLNSMVRINVFVAATGPMLSLIEALQVARTRFISESSVAEISGWRNRKIGMPVPPALDRCERDHQLATPARRAPFTRCPAGFFLCVRQRQAAWPACCLTEECYSGVVNCRRPVRPVPASSQAIIAKK